VKIQRKSQVMAKTLTPTRIAISALMIALLSACAQVPTRSNTDSAAESTEMTQGSQGIREEILFADAKIEAADRISAPEPVSTQPKIPLEINEDVQRWIDYFTGRGRERFQRYLQRGARYQEMVQETLHKEGIPRELYYLALIESGYATHARSSQKAVGVWQFIPGTARLYGLRLDRLVDERRDPIRSTRAAAAYLKRLHGMFHSWFLAMAAYNAGEGRIQRALLRGNTRDFWEMVDKKILPKETMNYIPKFLAAVIIGKNPEKYGFVRVAAEPSVQLAQVSVPPHLPLSEVARAARTTPARLSALNPHLLRGVTPQARKGYPLWLPSTNRVKEIQVALRKLPTPHRPDSAALRRVKHRVRPGETLWTIASHYRTSIHALKKMNRLSRNHIFVGQSLRIHQPGI